MGSGGLSRTGLVSNKPQSRQTVCVHVVAAIAVGRLSSLRQISQPTELSQSLSQQWNRHLNVRVSQSRSLPETVSVYVSQVVSPATVTLTSCNHLK